MKSNRELHKDAIRQEKEQDKQFSEYQQMMKEKYIREHGGSSDGYQAHKTKKLNVKKVKKNNERRKNGKQQAPKSSEPKKKSGLSKMEKLFLMLCCCQVEETRYVEAPYETQPRTQSFRSIEESSSGLQTKQLQVSGNRTGNVHGFTH